MLFISVLLIGNTFIYFMYLIIEHILVGKMLGGGIYIVPHYLLLDFIH